MGRRFGPWLVLVAVVGAMVAPALWRPPTDGYPLSTYPMFAGDRGPESVVATAVGLDAAGDRHRLSPELISGSDEPMLAIATVSRSVRDGRADALCAEIARRVAASGRDLEAVDVVVERHDSVAFFAGDGTPTTVTSHATCPVER
ncbi:MAG TPA: hypothetical protein VK866_01665 [Acidimicrobiales bacterium]|nr:hypothetical protein [Acidimicrobiales bacterium]